jgi:UDP-glucose 4-epimerase
MKCILYGGGGFIGSNLCAGLLSAGHDVRVFEYPHVLSQCKPDVAKKVEWLEGDFTNPSDVDQAMAGCDAVFHLVSTTLPKNSNENPEYDIETNLLATVRMLEAARRHLPRKIIFSSSGGTVYGIPVTDPITEEHPTDPICSYGIVKLAIEKYLTLFNVLHSLDHCILRIANPYGEGQRALSSQGAVAVFLHKALTDQPIEIWGDGSVVRDYIHVSDVVSAMVCALAYSGSKRVLNIGSGTGQSLNQLIQTIEHVLGRPIKRCHTDARQFDVPSSVLAVDQARQHLGWHPQVSLEDGIRRTVNWINGNS